MSRVETITDENNILGFGEGAVVEAELYYTIDPGDPGCYRTPNGDGWPEIPASVSLDAISILRVSSPDGEAIELTQEQEEAVVKFVDEDTQLRWAAIEDEIFEDAEAYREDMECYWKEAKHDRADG